MSVWSYPSTCLERELFLEFRSMPEMRGVDDERCQWEWEWEWEWGHVTVRFPFAEWWYSHSRVEMGDWKLPVRCGKYALCVCLSTMCDARETFIIMSCMKGSLYLEDPQGKNVHSPLSMFFSSLSLSLSLSPSSLSSSFETLSLSLRWVHGVRACLLHRNWVVPRR